MLQRALIRLIRPFVLHGDSTFIHLVSYPDPPVHQKSAVLLRNVTFYET